ncbi:hypothetical protein Vafri_18815 [Volvox africanus]|uniref:UBX domain-containing protein n=1 Tax=Volvox africanus TaxID=51714 RepID=A0A8J4BMR6_9CHLO|nr:hypothetical protein Vafri_18815 [Volvox africanus]
MPARPHTPPIAYLPTYLPVCAVFSCPIFTNVKLCLCCLLCFDYPRRTGGAATRAEAEDEDADLAAAIAASLQSHQPSQQVHQQHQPAEGGQGGAHDWPGPAGGGGGGGGGGGQGPYEGMYGDEYEDDPELAMAIAASLAEVGQGGGDKPPPGPGQQQQQQQQQQLAPIPHEGAEGEEPLELEPEPEAEGEGVIEVAFRLPNGTRCSRRFTVNTPSLALFTYVGPLLSLPAARIALSTAFPKKELERSRTTTLADLGLTHRTMLVAEPKR